MSPLEIVAALFTVVGVLLSVRRIIWFYPVGIVGTVLYFAVFAEARLYSSAGLQVFFTIVQFYGWWYWLKGANGGRPHVTRLGMPLALILMVLVAVGSAAVGWQISRSTNAASAVADSMITGLSMYAQILLDRKKLENWPVWGVVNALSVVTYFSQGLMLTAGLYLFLLGTAFLGWREWQTTKREAI